MVESLWFWSQREIGPNFHDELEYQASLRFVLTPAQKGRLVTWAGEQSSLWLDFDRYTTTLRLNGLDVLLEATLVGGMVQAFKEKPGQEKPETVLEVVFTNECRDQRTDEFELEELDPAEGVLPAEGCVHQYFIRADFEIPATVDSWDHRQTRDPRTSQQSSSRQNVILEPVYRDASPPQQSRPKTEENDVVFLFPRGSQKGRVLWGNTALLASVSPYFSALFASPGCYSHRNIDMGGYSEEDEAQEAYDRLRHRIAQGHDDPIGWRKLVIEEFSRPYELDSLVPKLIEHDTDDEADASGTRFGRSKRALRAFSAASCWKASTSTTVKVVIVKYASWRTFRAVLIWLSENIIRWSHLQSLHGAPGEFKENARFSASPKSVYRLAHQLELRDLQKDALYRYARSMEEHNVSTELNSVEASVYPELREAIELGFAAFTDNDVSKLRMRYNYD